jgi:hypothetical protein
MRNLKAAVENSRRRQRELEIESAPRKNNEHGDHKTCRLQMQKSICELTGTESAL